MKRVVELKRILIGLIVLLLLLAIGIIIFVKSSSKDGNKNDEFKPVENNTVNIDNNKKLIFDALSKYGKDIYIKGAYKNLSKNENGIYYATLNDLANMGFDISLFNDECDKAMARIYFDIEYKMANNYEQEPLLYVINCSNEVIDKNNSDNIDKASN